MGFAGAASGYISIQPKRPAKIAQKTVTCASKLAFARNATEQRYWIKANYVNVKSAVPANSSTNQEKFGVVENANRMSTFC